MEAGKINFVIFEYWDISYFLLKVVNMTKIEIFVTGHPTV